MRWHADYLFAVFPGRAAWLVDGALTECELAEALTARDDPAGAPARGHGAARRPPRFGAGDCRCAGHLVYMPGRLTKQLLRATLACIGDVRIASSTWA